MKFDKRLLRETGSIYKYVGLTVGLGGLRGLLIIVQAYCLTQIINGVFLKGQDLAVVGMLLAISLGVILVRAGLGWSSEVTANRAAGQVKLSLRERLCKHLFKLGPAYSQGERSGELTNTTIEGIESVDAYFSQYLPQMFLAVLVPGLVVVVVGFSDWLSGLVLLLTAPILVIFMILIGKLAETKTQRQWQSLSLMSAHFLDVLQGLTTLKLFGRSHYQVQVIERISNRFRRDTLDILKIAFLSALVMELGATLSTAIVAVEIGLRLLYGQIGFERAFFVLLLAPEFYLPLRSLGARFHVSMAGAEAAQRVFEILETPVASSLPFKTEPVPSLATATINFENVECGYDSGQRPALRGVSFVLEPGQTLALVGPSGAGKSTIANLLLRFIEPEKGKILVDGSSLQNFPAQEWRKQIAWVPQKPYLFNTSVANNIRLGKPDAAMSLVIAAAQAAHAHEFIQALPDGYDTVIGERGVRLSGGQAQRLSLARAFIKDAPLLILDEPTANLDPKSERLVLESLQRLTAGRTVIIIAHRLNTVRQANNIVVMVSGQVAEIGTHLALCQQDSLYSRLVRQSRLSNTAQASGKAELEQEIG